MKRQIAVLSMAGLLTAAQALASGYRIPEQSITSVALSAAYVANATTADTVYQNPANMGWLAPGWHSEEAITYINLPKIKYDDSRTSTYSGDSKTEEFLVPQIHLVAPTHNNFRFGLSLIHPAGLSKRWDESFPKTFASDFTLKVMELNPCVSYTFSDKYAIALGARLLRATGEVMSSGTIPINDTGTVFSTISRNMEGDTIEYGYNLAITAKASDKLTFALTYRSNVNLDLEGNATLSSSDGFLQDGTVVAPLAQTITDEAGVSVPVPAVLAMAVSYTTGNTTLEFVYDKTYWSEYKQLDFNYTTPLVHTVLSSAFDDPAAKNWCDTEAFRFGLTHHLNDRLNLMAGLAFDETPVPDQTLNFELPDSDAILYSLGARYTVNNRLEIGIAYLYDDKESRTVNNATVSGTFSDGGAHLLSLGGRYSF